MPPSHREDTVTDLRHHHRGRHGERGGKTRGGARERRHQSGGEPSDQPSGGRDGGLSCGLGASVDALRVGDEASLEVVDEEGVGLWEAIVPEENEILKKMKFKFSVEVTVSVLSVTV